MTHPATRPRSPSALAFALLFLLPALALAQDGGDVGVLVQVPTPLTADAATRINATVDAALAKEPRPAWVVYEFNPNGKDATAADFAAAYTLAKHVSQLTVRTAAFATGKVTGHAVLPLLCCQDVAMGRGAAVGEVVPGTDPPMTDPVNLAAYSSLVGGPKAERYAAVRKMFDKNVRLAKGTKKGGPWYFDLRDRAAFEKDGGRVDNTSTVAPEGVTGLFNTAKMEEFGLCKLAVDSRADLAAQAGIAPGSLRDDPIGGRAPSVFRYTLAGPITASVRESLGRTIKDVVARKGNVLLLVLDCDGGEDDVAGKLADDLIAFQHPTDGTDGILIVGFVPRKAADTGLIVALGCTDIVLSTRKQEGEAAGEAVFGDFADYLKKEPQKAGALAAMLRKLGEEQARPPLLLEAMVNADLQVVRARSKVNRGRTEVFTQEEFDAKKADWDFLGQVKPKGQLLALKATEAKQYGLVSELTDSADGTDILTRRGYDPAKVQEATPGWLDQFAAFLRLPVVTVLLVAIGFIGLILELKVPGTTVPGIVAALCFILVFWSWTGFSGQLAVLAGLLFLLGLILILLEVFVFPGFGATGVVGILLILAALALVTFEGRVLPSSGADWVKFGGRMAQYLFALIGGTLVAFVIARYLPKVPIVNKMALPAQDAADEPPLPGAAQAAGLLGAIGSATTVLRPAGTVQFGEQFVDVVSDGGFIPAGTRVQVVEVEGTRIVVKEV